MSKSSERDTAAVLDALMEREGITGYELAKRTSVNQQTIQRILTRESRSPRPDTLRPLAKYFDVSVAQIMGDEPLDHLSATVELEDDQLEMLHLYRRIQENQREAVLNLLRTMQPGFKYEAHPDHPSLKSNQKEHAVHEEPAKHAVGGKK